MSKGGIQLFPGCAGKQAYLNSTGVLGKGNAAKASGEGKKQKQFFQSADFVGAR
jgi:hypothetical protein